MEILDRVRNVAAQNAGLLKQARDVHAQSRRAVAAEIEAVNTKLASMAPGAVLLDDAKQADYLRLVERRARLHEFLEP